MGELFCILEERENELDPVSNQRNVKVVFGADGMELSSFVVGHSV